MYYLWLTTYKCTICRKFLPSCCQPVAPLQYTIAQLKEDNTKAEAKQAELQNQIKTLQISVSSLTEASPLTTAPPNTSMQSTAKSLSQLVILLQNVLTKNKNHPKLADATAIIASFTSEEGSKEQSVHNLSCFLFTMVRNTIQWTLGNFINSIDVDGQSQPRTVSEYRPPELPQIDPQKILRLCSQNF